MSHHEEAHKGDESVSQDNPPAGTHLKGTSSGNETAMDKGREAGRKDEGQKGAGRPAGTRTARDTTSINAKKEDTKTDTEDMPPA